MCGAGLRKLTSHLLRRNQLLMVRITSSCTPLHGVPDTTHALLVCCICREAFVQSE